MLNDIVANVIAGAVCTLLAYIFKLIHQWYKNQELIQTPVSQSHKKVLKKQFWGSIVTMIISLIVSTAASYENRYLRVSSWLFFGFSFVLVWGVFEELFRLYPDDAGKDKPPDEDANHTTDK